MNRPIASRPRRVPPTPRGNAPAKARALFAAVLVTVLAACATRPPEFPEPLRAPNPVPEQPQAGPADDRTRIVEGPTLDPGAPEAAAVVPAEVDVPPIPARDPVSLVLDGVPLVAFINVVFGTELGFGLEIEQSVRSRSELVSLRLTEPQAPERLYRIATEILQDYGIDVRERGGVLRFTPTPDAASQAPRMLTTRSLPDVPAGQRTVFVAMPLDISEPGRLAAQLRNLLGKSSTVTLTEMIEANALLISGPGTEVQAAMEAALVLDRAGLRDKLSLRINPLYLPVDQLAEELRNVLTAQGITVRSEAGSSGVLSFVPVASANALIVFSEYEQALDAVRDWVVTLDQPSEDGGSGGVYMYSARHTTVETLLPVLSAMVGGSAGAASASLARPDAADASPLAGDDAAGSRRSGQARGTTLSGEGGQVAIDPIRNVIVFQGDPQRWRAIQNVLARLDQPARQVVIEVTIAEVTLTDEFRHGVEWALRNIDFAGMSGPIGALGGVEPAAGALIWNALSSSGQTSAVLNLFAKDSRVSILSTPRLMVKSGESASIDVGTEVPIITSQATSVDLPTTDGDSSILQSIQYRKTGVLLEIEAVVHSGQRVDLHISQEVSEATPTDTSDISSPSIFSRRLDTSLSLSDGQSMLLGGLISSTSSDGKSKVPLLGDVPVLGRLFQNRTSTGARTELLMLITPYVVEDADQARDITDAIEARFGAERTRF